MSIVFSHSSPPLHSDQTATLPRVDILLAEDDADLCSALRWWFNWSGLSSQQVDHGARLADMIRAHRPRVVFLDLHMPGAWRPADMAQARASGLLDDVRMVVFSGAVDAHDRAQALGVDDVLQKPLNPGVLVQLVRQIATRTEPPR